MFVDKLLCISFLQFFEISVKFCVFWYPYYFFEKLFFSILALCCYGKGGLGAAGGVGRGGWLQEVPFCNRQSVLGLLLYVLKYSRSLKDRKIIFSIIILYNLHCVGIELWKYQLELELFKWSSNFFKQKDLILNKIKIT
jgi:hypothetical protein